MNINSAIKAILERVVGVRIYRTLPRGLDIFADVRSLLPQIKVEIIFDVGANVGQSALQYVKVFPDAQMYCFEPVLATFDLLQQNLRGRGKINSFRLALSEATGSGTMLLDGHSDQFSLHIDKTGDEVIVEAKTEHVPIESIDNFCSQHDIIRINYLKIDTEGNDLNVLKGGARMLAQHNIDIIEVEAGMSRRNSLHVPFDALTSFLADKAYFLFGIYEQVGEWPTKEPNLRRTNPVFISGRVIKANRGT
jgi:FkbM family methyltransferase